LIRGRGMAETSLAVAVSPLRLAGVSFKAPHENPVASSTRILFPPAATRWHLKPTGTHSNEAPLENPTQNPHLPPSH
jgi:hypothetical protein